MHPFSALTLGIFVAGYTTARWDLVTRLYELAIFAWDYGVVVSRPATPLALVAPRVALSLGGRVCRDRARYFLHNMADLSSFAHLVARRLRIRHTLAFLPCRLTPCGTSGGKRVRSGTTNPTTSPAPRREIEPRANDITSTLDHLGQAYPHASN